MIVLYIGPETTLPLASSLAAAFGVGLLLWSRIARLFRSVTGRNRKQSEESAEPSAETAAASGQRADSR